MPNKNYLSGRRLEYETVHTWVEKGYEAMRTAGSHGPFDVLAFRVDRKPEAIQCKVVALEAQADRLITEFIKDTIPSKHYHQTMTVKVKGGKLKQVTV